MMKESVNGMLLVVGASGGGLEDCSGLDLESGSTGVS